MRERVSTSMRNDPLNRGFHPDSFDFSKSAHYFCTRFTVTAERLLCLASLAFLSLQPLRNRTSCAAAQFFVNGELAAVDYLDPLEFAATKLAVEVQSLTNNLGGIFHSKEIVDDDLFVFERFVILEEAANHAKRVLR